MLSKLCVKNLCFSYGNELLFSDVSFQCAIGDTLVVTGKSGSGKSTLLEMCAGLVAPDSGTVLWDNVDILTYSNSQLSSHKQKIGFVFQKHALISNMSVEANITLPLKYHTNMSNVELHNIVWKNMKQLGLGSIATKMPEAISVGQRRLVSIARALIMKPDMLFLDEPASGLDSKTMQMVLSTILDLQKSNLVTMIIVSHQVDFISKMNTNVFELVDKKD